MEPGWMSLFDQIRYITGVLGVLFILCHGILKPRENYGGRVLISCAGAYLLAILREPLWAAISGFSWRFIVMMVYWFIMYFLPVAIVRYCYDTNWAGALFRTMMASYAENFMTIISYHILVLGLFRQLPVDYPWLYILIVVTIYTVLFVIAWYLLRRALIIDEGEFYDSPESVEHSYFSAHLFYIIIISSGKYFCEFEITPLLNYPELEAIYYRQLWFIIVYLLMTGIAMTIILYASYRTLTLRTEQQVLRQILRDREAQYAMSRESIENINRKCHDLKHQIRALEQISDAERREQLRQTRKAIDFYDAVVKTGNEALDTLLTEKSITCQNRNIRLSCTVKTALLDKIGLVDLYTLLGNAIDNAIEGVEKLSEEKRLISLTIKDMGQMLYIEVENYYDGTLSVEDGVLLTTKDDRENHGFGVRSIRMIAERYNGTVEIRTDGDLFSLQILMPVGMK